MWDSANPTSAAELRQYLKSHPTDAELETRLKENESKLAQMNSGIARTPAEQAAFAALNAHHLDEAEGRFMAMLEKDPRTDARAAAGMGFLRMQQNNFGAAISYLTQAEQNGFRDRPWSRRPGHVALLVHHGRSVAGHRRQPDRSCGSQIQRRARDAPAQPEALNGLAGVYTKQAAVCRTRSASTSNCSRLRRGSPTPGAVCSSPMPATGRTTKPWPPSNRFPAAVKADDGQGSGVICRTLATIYHAQNRSADAQRVLAQALALPFPDNGANLKQDTAFSTPAS